MMPTLRPFDLSLYCSKITRLKRVSDALAVLETLPAGSLKEQSPVVSTVVAFAPLSFVGVSASVSVLVSTFSFPALTGLPSISQPTLRACLKSPRWLCRMGK